MTTDTKERYADILLRLSEVEWVSKHYTVGTGPDRTEETYLECPRCHAEFRSGHHDDCPMQELAQAIRGLLEEEA